MKVSKQKNENKTEYSTATPIVVWREEKKPKQSKGGTERGNHGRSNVIDFTEHSGNRDGETETSSAVWTFQSRAVRKNGVRVNIVSSGFGNLAKKPSQGTIYCAAA